MQRRLNQMVMIIHITLAVLCRELNKHHKRLVTPSTSYHALTVLIENDFIHGKIKARLFNEKRFIVIDYKLDDWISAF